MKRFIYIIMVAAMMAACSKDESPVHSDSVAKITFAIQGDFTLNTHDFTRALTSDGKDMTDVWVLDYQGGELQQQLHQSDNTAADFGVPTLDLSIGTHHLYFVASRGTSPVLNTEAKTLTFTKVLDTFWRHYEITITSGTSSGSRAVSLDRVVTKLKVVFSDAIPTNAATFNITPTAWHYGFNYQTGNPTAETSQVITINIPNASIGATGESINVFGFSTTAEWNTNVAIVCKAANNDVLGSASLVGVPFKRNRVSEYTGPLFGDSGSMTLSLNTSWDDTYQGTW